MKPSRVLQNARQVLIDKGWCQGQLMNTLGQVCMLGAFMSVGPDTDLAKSKVRALLPYDESIGWWNDVEDRTVEEVLDLLDQATSIAMSEEAYNE